MKRYISLLTPVLIAFLFIQISYTRTELHLYETTTDANVNFSEVGDINGDGKDDLISIYGRQETQTLLTSVSFDADSGFNHIQIDDSRWQGTVGGQVFVEDVNGDNRDDLIFAIEDSNALVTVFLGNEDGTFNDAQTQQINVSAFENYHIQVGDVDGNQRFDLIFQAVTTNGSEGITYVMHGQSNGLFQH